MQMEIYWKDSLQGGRTGQMNLPSTGLYFTFPHPKNIFGKRMAVHGEEVLGLGFS